jgi:hypothetical protein
VSSAPAPYQPNNNKIPFDLDNSIERIIRYAFKIMWSTKLDGELCTLYGSSFINATKNLERIPPNKMLREMRSIFPSFDWKP